ncbi:MAG: LuxR C-terminal-related transcriptional regulator [Dehalococcoidia bacterium]
MLDRLSAGTRAFLVRSSILESFSASLCCEVTGLADGAERLMELRRTNQFLIGLDDRGEWFRYHHLFAELLRMELVQTEPELAPELHRRAAAWYRTQGNAVAAMRHALAVPDYALAAAIFIESAHPLCEMARFATVEGWMRQFPEPSITAHPRLALAMAWIAAEAYRPKADVERWLAIAAASDFPGPVFLGSRTMQSNVAIVHAGYLFDDIGRAVRAGELAVQEETDPTQYSYMLARGSFGEALYFAGRPAEARRFLEEAIAAPLAHRQTSGKTFWLALLAMASLDLGEPSRAEDLARQSVQLREQMGLTDHLFHWTSSLALAMVLCRQNRFTEAEAVLAEGVEPYLPALGDWRVFQALALLILAPVRYARGHAEAANSLLDEVRAMIAACPDPGMLPALLATTERSLHRLPRRATGLRQDLSDGELRVLRLLASDLNQREISRELYLSVNTVKTHARNIYTKLDAGSRAEAVTRARALGLIA